MSFTLSSGMYANKLLFAALLIMMSFQTANAVCTVSTSGLNFGGYDVFEQNHTDFTGTIEVTCDTSTNYTLKLSSGYGTVNDRFMLFNSHQLHYNLFVDTARTMVWGDGVSGDSTLSGSTASNQTHTVYGRILSGQNARIGDYQDSVIVTLETTTQ